MASSQFAPSNGGPTRLPKVGPPLSPARPQRAQLDENNTVTDMPPTPTAPHAQCPKLYYTTGWKTLDLITLHS